MCYREVLVRRNFVVPAGRLFHVQEIRVVSVRDEWGQNISLVRLGGCTATAIWERPPLKRSYVAGLTLPEGMRLQPRGELSCVQLLYYVNVLFICRMRPIARRVDVG